MRHVPGMDRLGAFRVRNVLRKRMNEQEGYKWLDREDKTVGSDSVWFWRERTAASPQNSRLPIDQLPPKMFFPLSPRRCAGGIFSNSLFRGAQPPIEHHSTQALNVWSSDAILASCRKSHPPQPFASTICEKRTRTWLRSTAWILKCKRASVSVFSGRMAPEKRPRSKSAKV